MTTAAVAFVEALLQPRLTRGDWVVREIEHAAGLTFVSRVHYARGASRTSTYRFGLFSKWSDLLCGVTLWLPPTRVAAESVDRARWRQVLACSRMAVLPGVPKNGRSFLLGASVRQIKRDRRFVALVSYADESQGHDGHVYRAAGWTYAGRRPGNPRWVDPRTGRQVASQSTRTRTHAQMEALGYVNTGRFAKHKFVLHLGATP